MSLNQEDRPAPAQDEQEAPVVVATAILGGIYHGGSGPELGEIDIEVCMPALEALQCETVNSSDDVFLPLMSVAQHERIVAALTRPAQTEQQPEQDDSLNMEPEGANAYLVVDPDDNYHICYVVRSKGQALQHATDGLLAFGPITQGNDS